jgi:hypothetical protein
VPDDTPIWRYTDVSRFALLVLTRILWFTKVRHLLKGDPYEAYGVAVAPKKLELEHGRPYLEEILGAVLHVETGLREAKDVNEAADRLFVSSWCMGTESLGMSMLYGARGKGAAPAPHSDTRRRRESRLQRAPVSRPVPSAGVCTR